MTAPMFVIWSFEHDAWWRPAWSGYTVALDEAGTYTANEAAAILERANFVTVNEQSVPVERAAEYQPPPSFACPRCRRRSFNANDIRERYCGSCHQFREAT